MFLYIIQNDKPQKLCFGSGCPREILGFKGLTPYMRYHTLENNPNVAPWSYDPLKSFKSIHSKPCLKSISKKGYGGVNLQEVAIKCKYEYPAPWTYAPETYNVKVKQSKCPFDSSVKRSTFKTDCNPGPGTYEEWKRNGLEKNLAVEIKCCPTNKDVCSVCNEQPVGDYWHKNYKEILCSRCMLKRRSILKKGTRQHLNKFRKIRDCSGIHFHDGTDAKIWLIEPQMIAKCLQKEAYLSSYFDE